MRNKKSVLMTLNHNYGCFSTVAGIAGNIKLYSIEQIEKAIDESDIYGDKVYLKQAIINNLTK